MSPAQCRAARGLLDWTQPDLAKRSGISKKAIIAFERGATTRLHRRTSEALIAAFEEAGIVFINRGVRLRGSAKNPTRGED